MLEYKKPNIIFLKHKKWNAHPSQFVKCNPFIICHSMVIIIIIIIIWSPKFLMWLKGQSFIRRFSQIWVSTRYQSKSKLSIFYISGYLVELNIEIWVWLSIFFQNPTIQNPPKSFFFSHLKIYIVWELAKFCWIPIFTSKIAT